MYLSQWKSKITRQIRGKPLFIEDLHYVSLLNSAALTHYCSFGELFCNASHDSDVGPEENLQGHICMCRVSKSTRLFRRGVSTLPASDSLEIAWCGGTRESAKLWPLPQTYSAESEGRQVLPSQLPRIVLYSPLPGARFVASLCVQHRLRIVLWMQSYLQILQNVSSW